MIAFVGDIIKQPSASGNTHQNNCVFITCILIKEMPLQIELDFKEFFDSDSAKNFYWVILDDLQYIVETTKFLCSFRQRGGDDTSTKRQDISCGLFVLRVTCEWFKNEYGGLSFFTCLE